MMIEATTLPLSLLEPIRLIRECDRVIIQYMSTKASFNLSATRPIEVIPGDDPMTVEPMDPMLLTIRQFDEDGNPQTICLTPLAAIKLAQALDSYLYFPMGLPSSENDNVNTTPQRRLT